MYGVPYTTVLILTYAEAGKASVQTSSVQASFQAAFPTYLGGIPWRSRPIERQAFGLDNVFGEAFRWAFRERALAAPHTSHLKMNEPPCCIVLFL